MTHCHSPSVITNHQDVKKRIALIGQPNTGKSTFFNHITKANAGVANWPGLTVDLATAVVKLGEEKVEFVDLPGIYDLNGFSDDEKVVKKFLENYAINLVVVIVNASQIDRQIKMPLQIKALGLPAILLLNMADEAKRYGVKFDATELSKRLEMPVYPISAKQGIGCARAKIEITKSLDKQIQAYQIQDVSASLTKTPIEERDIATILANAVEMPSIKSVTFTNRIDAILLHPVWGLPLFFLSMFLIFWVIWSIGIPSADPVDAITGWLQSTILEPIVSFLPLLLQDLLINGIWAGCAALVSFLPLVAIFFVMMSILEDSGYLSRAAYLMDGLMGKLGLDGRGFVLQMMGFGCNVPAIMGTRVMRSRAVRLLTMLIIPFSLCSARLQVFVFILAAVLPKTQGAIALFLLYVISFATAFVIAGIFSRNKFFQGGEPFILELPPYRFPTLKQVFLRVWGEMKQFISRLLIFMVIGTTLIWFLTTFPLGSEGLDTFAGKIGQIFAPLMQPLGINPLLSVSLIFGFVAKEVQIAALTVIYGLSEDALGVKLSESLTFAQGFSYCLFSLLYIPCLTTLATIWGESRSLRFTLISVGIPLFVAWMISLIFYQGYQFIS